MFFFLKDFEGRDNGQSTGSSEVDTVTLNAFFNVSTLFVIYMNILKYVVNIYADDTRVYRCIARYLPEQCLAADHSPDLTFTDVWGKYRSMPLKQN